MRLQIKDATFDEEEMLNTGKTDALKRIQEDIEEETQRRGTQAQVQININDKFWTQLMIFSSANAQCYL